MSRIKISCNFRIGFERFQEISELKKLALEAFRSILLRSLSIIDHKPTDGITKSNTIIENFAKTNPARNRRISVPPQGGLFHWNISYRVLGYRVGGQRFS